MRKGKSDDGIGAWEAGVKLDTKMGSAFLDPRHQRAYTQADANGRVDGWSTSLLRSLLVRGVYVCVFVALVGSLSLLVAVLRPRDF